MQTKIKEEQKEENLVSQSRSNIIMSIYLGLTIQSHLIVSFILFVLFILLLILTLLLVLLLPFLLLPPHTWSLLVLPEISIKSLASSSSNSSQSSR